MTKAIPEALDAFAEAAAELALAYRQNGTPSPQEPTGAAQAPSIDDLPFEDFEDTPQARSKGGGCPIHGIPWTVKAAGTSTKTGAPYSAFWKCEGKNPDDSFCREKPTPAWQKAHPAR